jgi:hypothetical protein
MNKPGQQLLDRKYRNHIWGTEELDVAARMRHIKRHNGDVAQLGERGVRNAEARGSIPLISTRT